MRLTGLRELKIYMLLSFFEEKLLTAKSNNFRYVPSSDRLKILSELSNKETVLAWAWLISLSVNYSARVQISERLNFR